MPDRNETLVLNVSEDTDYCTSVRFQPSRTSGKVYFSTIVNGIFQKMGTEKSAP